MNRILGAMLLAAAILMTHPLDASARVGNGCLLLSPGFGGAVPLSKFRDDIRAGYTSGISLDYMVSESAALGVELSGTRFKPAVHEVRSGFFDGQPQRLLVRDSWKLVQYGIHARMYAAGAQAPNPFVEGGICATSAIFGQAGTLGSSERVGTVLGFKLGVGFDLYISNFVSGVMTVTYHTFNWSNEETYRFWTARFGLAFQFRPI
ncbi:MAG: hypothetical protein HZB43_03745 [candidate division Zixibacteria bacterium]|nr:hypothetical protein [candidate division Zixibacteria bacterium]